MMTMMANCDVVVDDDDDGDDDDGSDDDDDDAVPRQPRKPREPANPTNPANPANPHASLYTFAYVWMHACIGFSMSVSCMYAFSQYVIMYGCVCYVLFCYVV